MTEERSDDERLQCEVAWLMWCIDQGYVNPEDRAIMTNWFLEDPASLSVDDRESRPQWLVTADEVIRLVRAAVGEDV